jgi:hypothetical protein
MAQTPAGIYQIALFSVETEGKAPETVLRVSPRHALRPQSGGGTRYGEGQRKYRYGFHESPLIGVSIFFILLRTDVFNCRRMVSQPNPAVKSAVHLMFRKGSTYGKISPCFEKRI